MKMELRLTSVVRHGVGGPEAQAIDLIYMFLLHEFEQDIYRRIGINQIGDDLDEFVMKESGNRIHCNIRYPVFENFEERSEDEQNKIRLDVVHTALLRIAEFDKKLNINQLEKIREKILSNNFNFSFICRSFLNKRHENLEAKIIVHPEAKKFDYFLLITESKKEKCRIHLYSGLPVVFFGEDFFFYGKWNQRKEFTISGKRKEVDIRISIDNCNMEIINLTSYSNPPWFTLMKADISESEREQARKDWEHSLPPATLAVIRMMNEGGNN